MTRIWTFKDADAPAMTPELIAAAENIPVLAKLLAIRGITDPEEARAFLNLSDYQPTAGDAFPDMAKAVERINRAIQTQQPILVYGDFDVDGITGTSVLMQCLRQLGASVSYYIPDRHTEGHGLNSTSLCRLVSSRQVKLVITTDTGITNFNEVHLLGSLGVDTIITDHHELPENLPPAYATLNPKLLPSSSPMAHLAGVGMAFKLSEALFQSVNAPQSQIDALLDLVAVGTVVDMVPLIRENRYLVWRGLQQLQHRERIGINALLQEANINDTAPIQSQTLGFVIGPRLNALGRLAKSDDAVELLTTDDAEKARPLAAKLEQMNRQRKELVEQSVLQAETHLSATGELTDQKAIILASKDWNPGIVGLMATKLIEKHHRPCFIGYVDDDTQEVRFSARSIPGFNMHENLRQLEDLFIRWGGHSGAAGFSILQKDLPKLKARLFQLCAERITHEQMLPVTTVDMALTFSQINPFLIDIVNRMAPFGQENPYPVFALENVTIGAQRTMGEDQRHLKLILTGGEPGQYLEAIHWNWGSDRPKLNPTQRYRLAFTADLNTYNGVTKMQLLLKDVQDPQQTTRAEAKAASMPVSMPIPVSMTSAVKIESSSESSMPAEAPASTEGWIDHRGRDAMESFLHQILTPALQQAHEPAYRIFCEGTQQRLPLPVAESLFCGRNSKQPEALSPHMILWDVPPDMLSLVQLVRMQQPKTIHLMGGKYEKIPLYRPPREFLDGFLKVLHRLPRQASEEPLMATISQLAMMLSTSHAVVTSGLSLLSRLQFLSVAVLSEPGQLKITMPDALKPVQQDISEMIEYMAFRSALQDVYQFREWIMTAPLAAIRSAVTLELTSGTRVLHEERTSLCHSLP